VNSNDWQKTHPGKFFLDPDNSEALTTYLVRSGFLPPGERVKELSKAGDGNMNCTVRVRAAGQSFIVKQARPWVEKYPQFPAPSDRALREAEFYGWIAQEPSLANRMPRLLQADAESRVLILEDMGDVGDYTAIYKGESMQLTDIHALADFLTILHRESRDWPKAATLANREMRQLNCQHIFFIPYQNDNGLDLDAIQPGLQSMADALKAQADLVATIRSLSEPYLHGGACLLHGDFFPGSFLKSRAGLRVIDPEFCFFGNSEWDPAVFIAHLLLARQDPKSIRQFLARYQPPSSHDDRRMMQWTGTEILRRLIGYAQLPLNLTLEEREELLKRATHLVLNPTRSLFG